ncbi:MAG: hypothetical protein C3F18_04010 [Nitrosomonadales bacterium]|nr:MAG: hypothetical protein C3F18_04010 [Nitrosomonadales bacterium]
MLLGELAVHSHLGQPLRASIPLKADLDEELDSRCFSLARPEGQGDHASYLTQARLTLVESGGQRHLQIHSAQAINEPFLRLLVQGNCGQGHLSREFTLLLDPVEYEQRPVSPAREVDVIQVPVLRPDTLGPAPSVAAVSKPRAIREAVKKADAHLPAEQVQAPQPAAPEGGFRLKLSTAGLDLTMAGKMTEAQRQQLREKQLLLDADDQVANTLSMKNRIRQLEEQIQSMQKALEQNNSRMRLSEKLAIPAVQKTAPTLTDAAANWLENTSFRSMAGVGLIVALMVSGWWRWRRRQAEAQLESELEHEFAVSEMPKHPPLTSRHQAGAARPHAADQEDDFLASATSIFDNESESVTFTEAESVLDEADLYLAYGWANRAIELLQEYLEKHPDDVQLWKKLFEIYSSQGMKQEFEQLALRCQSTMYDSGLRVLVQKLGRQLDAGNPLYLSSPEVHEEGALEPSAGAGAEEGEAAALDVPLDFVLDDERPPKPEADKEVRHLELDPLFPELDQNARLLAGNGNGGKAPG